MFVLDFLRLQYHGVLCLLLGLALLFPDGASGQQSEVETSWEIRNDVVVITYQLFVPLDITYDISVVLRKKSDRSFRLFPKTIEGDLGRLEYTGGKKVILWHYKKDLRRGLTNEDNWFQITAAEIRDGGGISWWVYAAGGAAAAVVGAILLLNGDDEPDLLPEPPNTRPGKN